jgi:hypothetical protein
MSLTIVHQSLLLFFLLDLCIKKLKITSQKAKRKNLIYMQVVVFIWGSESFSIDMAS